MDIITPASTTAPLEWRKASPISHGDFKGFDGDRPVARIYLAVSDISLNENWHWALTLEHDGLPAEEIAGQAPSHTSAADAAEHAYARFFVGPDTVRSRPDAEDGPSETDLVAHAVDLGSDA